MDWIKSIFGRNSARNDDTIEEEETDTVTKSSYRGDYRGRNQEALPPLLTEVTDKSAEVQGLDWYKESLLEDKDGDQANTFLEEIQKNANKQARKYQKMHENNALQSAQSGLHHPVGKSKKLKLLSGSIAFIKS